MSLEKVIGTWDPLIGPEFYKPYMKELQKTIEGHKKSFFSDYKQNEDMFHMFKSTPINKLKVVIVTQTDEFDSYFAYGIEDELLDGFDINIAATKNYKWLMEQGIMFLPRELTWGNPPHREWHVFTDEVINIIAGNPDIMIVTHIQQVKDLVRNLHPNTPIYDFISWKNVDKWCKDKFNTEINWSLK